MRIGVTAVCIKGELGERHSFHAGGLGGGSGQGIFQRSLLCGGGGLLRGLAAVCQLLAAQSALVVFHLDMHLHLLAQQGGLVGIQLAGLAVFGQVEGTVLADGIALFFTAHQSGKVLIGKLCLPGSGLIPQRQGVGLAALLYRDGLAVRAALCSRVRQQVGDAQGVGVPGTVGQGGLGRVSVVLLHVLAAVLGAFFHLDDQGGGHGPGSGAGIHRHGGLLLAAVGVGDGLGQGIGAVAVVNVACVDQLGNVLPLHGAGLVGDLGQGELAGVAVFG